MDQPQVTTPGSPNTTPGAPDDTPGSSNDIYANPPDVDHLELEPGHPGLNDPAYVERRRALELLRAVGHCRRLRDVRGFDLGR